MQEIRADLAAVERIASARTILDVIARTTGMGFAAIARVTEERWIACAVEDRIGFGLRPGDELTFETPIWDEISRRREAVVIDDVAADTLYRGYPRPRRYRFESYISVPILLPSGRFFGTLCAIDRRAVRLRLPHVVGMFGLFAELVACHLEAADHAAATAVRLADEQKQSELREQFIAVLGHDLRNPLSAIAAGAEMLALVRLDDDAQAIVDLISASAVRMCRLINNVMDFTRGRLGDGLKLNRNLDEPLAPVLQHVVAELQARSRDRVVNATISLRHPVLCDRVRMAQLLSNLLGNALKYGAPAVPVEVVAVTDAEWFELSVSNGGEPIDRATMSRLFEPFTRGQAHDGVADPADREGLGLGLFIASEVAKAHGGTLSVRSSAEQTRFLFRMPLR